MANTEAQPSYLETAARAILPWVVLGAGLYLMTQPGIVTKAAGLVTAYVGAQLVTHQ